MHWQVFLGTWQVFQFTTETEPRKFLSIGQPKEGRMTLHSTEEKEPKATGDWKVESEDLEFKDDDRLVKYTLLNEQLNDMSHAIYFEGAEQADMLIFRSSSFASGESSEPVKVLMARRVSWNSQTTDDQTSDPPDIDQRKFSVLVSSETPHSRSKGDHVYINKLCAPKLEGDKTLDIYGVFYEKHAGDKSSGGPDLYDLVVFDRRLKLFRSIFGIRTIRVDESEPNAQIFAAFERPMPITATHSSNQLNSFLDCLIHDFALLPCETGLLGASGDPDSGCWGGDQQGG